MHVGYLGQMGTVELVRNLKMAQFRRYKLQALGFS